MFYGSLLLLGLFLLSYLIHRMSDRQQRQFVDEEIETIRRYINFEPGTTRQVDIWNRLDELLDGIRCPRRRWGRFLSEEDFHTLERSCFYAEAELLQREWDLKRVVNAYFLLRLDRCLARGKDERFATFVQKMHNQKDSRQERLEAVPGVT